MLHMAWKSFYILHVNKCGFLVCRPADAETIPTLISQQDKLKHNQAQPPHLYHLSHLYHPSPPRTPSLLVHHLSHYHHFSPACIPFWLHQFCLCCLVGKSFLQPHPCNFFYCVLFYHRSYIVWRYQLSYLLLHQAPLSSSSWACQVIFF